ncbi:MAG: 50S ribosomal protein L25 [bacterium]|nr:50S ribosomal protein L25 [bacterium]
MKGKSIDAEIRTEKGKNANRRTRAAGYIPAVLNAHGESEAIKIKKKDFFDLFKGRVSESIIFDLNIKEGAQQMAFVKEYQQNPITDEIIHLDLFKVTAGEKITTQVPLEIVGIPKGIKAGGILDISERELEVECLPKDLPELIQVDVTELMPGDSIHVKDVVVGDNIKILSNFDNVIASVHIPRAVVEDEEVEEEGLEEGVEAATEETEE